MYLDGDGLHNITSNDFKFVQSLNIFSKLSTFSTFHSDKFRLFMLSQFLKTYLMRSLSVGARLMPGRRRQCLFRSGNP